MHASACPPRNHVTWFNCGVEVTDQVTNEPSHQVTKSLSARFVRAQCAPGPSPRDLPERNNRSSGSDAISAIPLSR